MLLFLSFGFRFDSEFFSGGEDLVFLFCAPEYWWPIMRTDAEGLEAICKLAAEGRLKIPVGQTFPLEMAAEAHRARDGKNAGGKVVLEVDQGPQI